MQIKATSLTHTYDIKTTYEFKALNDVSISIPEKGISAFVGHTGSGKTTFVKHINALLKPTEGEIQVGTNVFIPTKKKRLKNANDLRKNIGVVFQFPEDQIFSETVEEELMFAVKNFNLPLEEYKSKADKYLNLVGLDKSFLPRNPFELSGGEKRKVALASILLLEQEVIILDEPTSSLDYKSTRAVYDLLRELSNQGKKVIVITHELRHVLEFADDVTLFANQQIVASGDPIDIIYDIELLKKYELDIPKIVELTSKLETNGMKVKKSKSIDEFVNNFRKRGAHV